jgi:hypothetical protein
MLSSVKTMASSRFGNDDPDAFRNDILEFKWILFVNLYNINTAISKVLSKAWLKTRLGDLEFQSTDTSAANSILRAKKQFTNKFNFYI